MKSSDALDDALRSFRNCLYECFDRQAEAFFDLTDTVLAADVIPSPVHRWSWLILATYAQLRLERARVADRRLPWERRYASSGQLTPWRVSRTVSALLAELGTSADRRNPAEGRREGPEAAFFGTSKALSGA